MNDGDVMSAVQEYIKSKKQGDTQALIHTANMFNISALELQDVIQYLKVESVKESIEESIIDIPRKNYAKDIFDDYDKENPKLKQKIFPKKLLAQ